MAPEIPMASSPERTDAQVASAQKIDPAAARRVARAGLLGTILEYYDVSLYGLLAVVLAPQFFPSDNAAVSTIAALAVFATAYFMRPIGGIVFGRFGDRHGRRTTLVATILLMCLFSAAIGLLPTYATAGILAPILMVLCRLGQGFASGGEAMGATTYVMESVPPEKRGRYTAMIPMGGSLGYAVAALVVGSVTALVAGDALADWAWRIPFLLSLPLGLMCLWMRVRLEESVEFVELDSSDATEKAPLWEALRSAPLSLLRVAAYTFSLTTVGHIVMVYVSVLLIQQLGYDKGTVYWLTAVVIGLGALSAPMFGAWSDRIGRRPLMIGAPLATIVFIVPLFLVLTTTTNLLLAGLVFLALMVLCQAYSPGYTVFVESFPTRIRYTASAFGYNVGIVLSGFAPALSAGLVDSTGSLISPAWLAVGAAVLGVAAALSLRERTRVS